MGFLAGYLLIILLHFLEGRLQLNGPPKRGLATAQRSQVSYHVGRDLLACY
jgi:hypothetical protein